MSPNPWNPARWKPLFFGIWGGQAFSLVGSQLVQFALVWWLTKTTGSATVLATATMMALLPQILVTPFAGTLVDRWNRRWVMVGADATIAAATVGLAILFALGAVRVWHVYLLMLVRSAGGAFHWPAMQSSTTLMVPKRHLARIGGLNQSLFGLANIISPPLGALLLEVLPMQGVLAVDVVTALIAIVPLLLVGIPLPVRAASGRGMRAVFSDMATGLRFALGWRGLTLIIGVAALINLLVHPAVSLQPLLVTAHFGGGALQLAYLESAFGVGVILGGLLLSAWGGFRRRVITAFLALALEGVAFALVGLTPATAFYFAVGAMLVVGLMNSASNGSFLAILQGTVPPEIQWRVLSLLMSGVMAVTPLGLAIAGPVADMFGVRIWYVVSGATMAVAGALAFFVPALMELESRSQPQGSR
ncbi:MAG: MFS transporter [Candidatus Bipolaricaulaceae bacterium]